jgi:hypothetical protein
MHRFPTESLAENQATGKRFIIGILFDDFTLENADKDFIERQEVCLGLFICMVGNPYPVTAYRVKDVLDVHLVPSFKRALESGSAPVITLYHSGL